jgi:hypothetical protein
MDNHDQEPWKMPLRHYIEHLYFKNFHKEKPEVVLSIEEQDRAKKEKKAQKRREKFLRRQQELPEKDQSKDRTK